MMDAPPWSLRELVILLNVCNERSVGLRIDGSLIAPIKLVLFHVHPVPFLEAIGEPFKFFTIDLSDDVQEIWKFLGVPLLNLDNQFERHEEIFDIVVKHRFFHISRMTMRLGLLQMRPTESPEEFLILHEFMAWWFRGVNVHTNIRDSKCFTYDEVTTLSLAFFGTDKKKFSEWEMQCAQWTIQSAQLQIHCAQWQINQAQRPSTSVAAPIQVPQQQEQDNQAP